MRRVFENLGVAFSMHRVPQLSRRFSAMELACALLVCVPLLANPAASAAQDCSELADKTDCGEAMAVESPRGLALGTGVRAAAISTSALAYSPAALAMGSLYHIEGNLDYMAARNTVALGAGVVDSSTSKLGAGFGLRGFLSGEEGGDGIDGRLGLAVALSEAFSIGVLGRYIDVSVYAPDSAGMKTLVGEAEGFTMDASLRVIPVAGLQIDLGALNFIDLDAYLVPTMLSASFAVAVGSELSLGMDLLTDMSTFKDPGFTLGGGAEYLVENAIPLRAGYSADLARKIHALGLGIGFTDEQLGLDIGVHQQVSGGKDTRIMFAARYYVD